MLSKVPFVWAAFAALFFVYSCQRVKDRDPRELSELYYDYVLTFSKGMDGCIGFVKDYGFYSGSQGKIPHNKNTAKSACERASKDKVVRWGYTLEKIYRNEELGRANYELVLMVDGTIPYRRNIGFERLEGRWRFYIAP